MNKLRIFWGLAVLLLSASGVALAGDLPLVTVAGAAYIDLQSFSRGRGFDYSWDPLVKNATLRSNSGDLRFHVGSDYFLDGGRLVRLNDKTRYWGGRVLAPLAAGNYLTKFSTSPPTPPKPVTLLRTFPAPTHRLRRVVIDAGHGGEDLGAVSPFGTVEKELVLEIARRVRDELTADGLEVMMTRNSDVFIPLSERARLANVKQADFFVSIHANAAPTRSLRGFEVYTLSEATNDATLALERAENSSLRFEKADFASTDKELKAVVWDLKESENRRQSLRIAHNVAASVERAVPLDANRLRTANFYVLKWTECPAVLIEVGYITNRGDERRLKSSIYRQDLADGIVQGVLGYKREFERTDGFTR